MEGTKPLPAIQAKVVSIEKGEMGKSQGVGQLLPEKGPGWMGIRQHEQKAGPASKLSRVILLMHGVP